MAELKELSKRLNDLQLEIERMLYYSEFEEYEDLSGVDYNKKNADDLFLIEEYRGILDKLADVKHTMNYLNKRIVAEGTLYLNDSGRYQINGSNIYYTSGYGIEFLQYDEWRECEVWHSSRVEHNGENYYIVGFPDVSMDNLKVRVRER